MKKNVEPISRRATDGDLESSIFLRMIEYGLTRPDGFTRNEILGAVCPKDWEEKIVADYLDNAVGNKHGSGVPGSSTNRETPFFAIRIDQLDHQSEMNLFIINFSSYFNYLDYQELKHARANAREARMYSWVAIFISVLAVVVSVLVPYFIAEYVTQEVHVVEK